MILNKLPCRAFFRRQLTDIRYLCSAKNGSNNGSGDDPKNPKNIDEDEFILGIPQGWDGKTVGTDEKRKLKPPPPLDPVRRTNKIMVDDFKRIPKHLGIVPTDESDYIFPTHCDVLIIGGGAIGSSVAFWLREQAREGLRIVVLEKDPTYKNAATAFSVGELHQQFSLEENIQMANYAAEFLRKSKEFLGPHVNVNYVPSGYLTLASEEDAEKLHENSIMQNRLGAKNITLTTQKLAQRFPWLNLEGVELGCFGLENEGWFSPWQLLMGFKWKALSLGVEYVPGELVNFDFGEIPGMEMIGVEEGTYSAARKAIVKMNDGTVKDITFSMCVLAAGAGMTTISDILRLGKGQKGMRSVPLPLLPRRRHYYVVKMDQGRPLGLNVPQVIDTRKSNIYFRRDSLSDNLLVEKSSEILENLIEEDVPSDKQFFEKHIREALVHRVPSFKDCSIEVAASGFYEYCPFDENGIIGSLPAYHNMYIATGFNGHGIQMAPAAGRAISQAIINGEYMSIDLTRLGYDRFMVREPMYDENLVK